jgi:hypothetical protein
MSSSKKPSPRPRTIRVELRKGSELQTSICGIQRLYAMHHPGAISGNRHEGRHVTARRILSVGHNARKPTRTAGKTTLELNSLLENPRTAIGCPLSVFRGVSESLFQFCGVTMKTNLTDRQQIASDPSFLIEPLLLTPAVGNRPSVLRKDLCRFPALARSKRVLKQRRWISDLQENRGAPGRAQLGPVAIPKGLDVLLCFARKKWEAMNSIATYSPLSNVFLPLALRVVGWRSVQLNFCVHSVRRRVRSDYGAAEINKSRSPDGGCSGGER